MDINTHNENRNQSPKHPFINLMEYESENI